MAGRRKDEVERRLTELRQAEEQSLEECGRVARDLIGHRSSILVGAAARVLLKYDLTCDHQILRDAYERFLVDPTETDKGCRAKLPLCEVLTARDFEDPDFYIAGMKYVQMDPAYGDPEDSAPNLRGLHAYGLIGCRFVTWTAVMPHLVDLLNDSTEISRAHAARAISEHGSPAAVWLLRHHVQRNEFSSDVVGECMTGMMKNDGDNPDTLNFVGSFLFGDDAIAAEAAEALCQSRTPQALKTVINVCETPRYPILEAALLSLSICRETMATDYLLSLIRSGESRGVVALKSMAPNRYYPDILRQVTEAVAASNSPLLEQTFRKHFQIET